MRDTICTRRCTYARPTYARAVTLRLLSRVERITYHLIVQLLNLESLIVIAPRPSSCIVRGIVSCASRGCAASSRKSIKREALCGRATPRVLSDGVGPCVRAGSS